MIVGTLWRWLLEDDGRFTVKTLSKIVDNKYLHEEGSSQETVWNKIVPKKVNIFIWRALKRRLPVRSELDKRGIDLDTILCPCCNDTIETIDHCLVSCNMASDIWEKVFLWWKIGPFHAFSINEVFRHCGNETMPNQMRNLWKIVTWVTGYHIWKERNNRVFRAKISSLNKIVQDIKLQSYEWIVRRAKEEALSWKHGYLIQLIVV